MQAQQTADCMAEDPCNRLRMIETTKLKQQKNIKRIEDTLWVKAGGKKFKWINIMRPALLSDVDTSCCFAVLNIIKNEVLIQKISAQAGFSFILLNLSTGSIKVFEGLPQFSPTGNRVMVLTGKLHNPYTKEAVSVFKRHGGTWKLEYQTEAKALESYPDGTWKSEHQILLTRLDWGAKTSDGGPNKTATRLIFTQGEWHKQAQK